VEAASKLTAEELTRDFGTADKSAMGTLVHMFGVDRNRRWNEWADGLTDEAVRPGGSRLVNWCYTW